MYKKIAILSVIAVALFLATSALTTPPVFSAKNYNSAKSNTTSIAPALDFGSATSTPSADDYNSSRSNTSAVAPASDSKSDSITVSPNERTVGAGQVTEIIKEVKPIIDESTKSALNESNFKSLSGKTISVRAVEVRGWDPKQKKEFLTTVKIEAEVKSKQELKNFAKGVLLKDEKVASINIKEDKTQVAYKMPVKLFGIFNSSLKVQIDTDAKGKIKVKYPWYKFLFKKLVSASELKSKVEVALPEVGDEVLVKFEQQAKIIQIISNILKSSHDSAMNAIRNMK